MSDLLKLFSESNERMIDSEGIRLTHAIAEAEDGGLTMMAMNVSPRDRQQTIDVLRDAERWLARADRSDPR